MDVKVKIEFQVSLNSLETIGEVKEYVCGEFNRLAKLQIYKDEIKVKEIWNDKGWQ